MNAKLMGLVAVGSLIMGASVQAAELGRYSFTGAAASGGAGTDGTIDTQPANAAFGNFFNGSGTTETDGTATNDYRATGWNLTNWVGSGNAPAAADANDYYSFTFTPATTGFSISDITFSVTRPNQNAPRDIAVRGSLTGNTDLYSALDVADDTGLHTYNAPVAGYTNLAANAAVTFYIFGQDADSESGTWTIDNVIINGTPGGPIPEPASIGLVGLAGMALLRRRA